MEFPNLGENCSLKECNRLDFLPIKCSGCKRVFCSEHYQYRLHKCEGTQIQDDHQVPICPLCNSPVPMKFDQSPDTVVSLHMDKNCRSDREKVFKNRCSVPGCRIKELMPLKCELCHKNHCLQHRHPSDHDCKRSTDKAYKSNTSDGLNKKSITIPATLNSFSETGKNAFQNIRTNFNKIRHDIVGGNNPIRSQQSSTNINNRTDLQGDLTEDEALRIAISQSLDDMNIDQSARNNNQNNNSSTANRPNKPQDNCRIN